MSVQVKRGNALAALSITPLIDVVFLLLIFFLVTSRFEQEERAVEVALPAASEAQPLIAEPREMFINVDRQGRYVVDGQVLDAAGLEAALRQAVANNPANQVVIIRGDKHAEYDAIFQAVRLCSKLGIADCTLAGEE